MKILGITGWSGSGKTSLIVRLLPELTARGLSVSTVKRAHHRFDVDRPGKDSFRHREAGAHEVLVSSDQRYALMGELRGAPEPGLDELLSRLAPVDLVLVEGFKGGRHEKIEVWRADHGAEPLWPHDPQVVALATEGEPPGNPPRHLHRLALADAAAIADFILHHCGLADRGSDSHAGVA